MAAKDITDVQVCRAVLRGMEWTGESITPASQRQNILAAMTGEHPKVCWRALERAQGRGLIDCGVGLQRACLTEKGLALLAESGGR